MPVVDLLNPIRVEPKVKAAAVAGTTGVFISVIAIYILDENGVKLPPEVAAAATGLIVQVTNSLAGYLKRN